MANSEARIIVFYSAPSDTPRLRLDQEHRAMDDVLRELHLEPSLIQRIHATSVEDLTRSLQEKEYEIVQFSGHGSESSIFLEDRHQDTSMAVPAGQIAQILRETSPNLKVAIFMSCYSAESIPDLVEAAPYLVTATGNAVDDTAIVFITQFYNAYLRTGSVEHAFNMAQNFISLVGRTGSLNTVLSRRAVVRGKDRVLFQAFPSGKDDSILLDLTEAESDIASLNIPRDAFLGLLSRKIRVHRWVFNAPRQRVVLSLGPYFGLFSWQDAKDVVVCHRILKVRPDVDEQICEAWASLIVNYNDHYTDRYRTTQEPQDPMLASWLPQALDEYLKTYQGFFEESETAHLLRQTIPDQFKVAKALIAANLKMAETKIFQEDYASAVKYLETILSAIHDVLDSLTSVLTM